MANWVFEIASKRVDNELELIDLLDYPLPHPDEPMPPSLGKHQNQHTKDWAVTISRFDGYNFRDDRSSNLQETGSPIPRGSPSRSR